MDRRSCLKLLLGTTAVGVVAPQKLLPAPPPWIGFDAAAGASRVAVGMQQYEIVMDAVTWEWIWMPVSGTRFFLQGSRLTNNSDPGEDSSAMMKRATLGHTFTPAAQPQGNQDTSV